MDSESEDLIYFSKQQLEGLIPHQVKTKIELRVMFSKSEAGNKISGNPSSWSRSNYRILWHFKSCLMLVRESFSNWAHLHPETTVFSTRGASCADSSDQLLDSSEEIPFADRSSYFLSGGHKAGHIAVVSQMSVTVFPITPFYSDPKC